MDNNTSTQTNAGPQTHRPPSPVPSGVSMRSGRSKEDVQPNLSTGPVPPDAEPQTHRPPSPVPSGVSMRSGRSKEDVQPNLSTGPVPPDSKPQTHRPPSPVPSGVSMRSGRSKEDVQPNLSTGPVPPDADDLTQDQSRCGVCEQVLRDPVITTCGHSFCRQCISSFWKQPGLAGDQACAQCGKTCRTQPLLQPPLDDHTDMSTQDEHTDLINSRRHLHTEHTPGRKRELDEDLRRVIENHKAGLKKRFENISEGIVKPGAEILLNTIYTELYITEGESEGVNKEHEVWQIESASRRESTEDTPINCNDIFKPLPGQEKHIRTVMTKGVAGIGKTVSVQKFILDWTDGVANQDADFIFPLSFRGLNLVRHDKYSLHKLLLDFHPELKDLNDNEGYKDCRVVFIFDGLDESRLTLDLEQKSALSDVKQTSTVDVLMTSLIRGTLLPSALIWITSRPTAASQIPAQYIDQVTEVRGFNDPQKEEYFRKKISDESQASKIISHIKVSRSLHIICHIPVFCWIAATVLQQILEKKNIKYIPKTLTEMFIHFLLIQTIRKEQKYQSETEADIGLKSQRNILLKLAELAFKNLENGHLMFYEEDLQECGINISEASVYSGMCTEIFKEEYMCHKGKAYCFVHLSIQEFLAALYVFHSYLVKNITSLESFICDEHRDELNPSVVSNFRSILGLKPQDNLHVLLKSAVDKALKSQHGHLDLFLRFLMGISLESNHRLLQGVLNHTHNSSNSIKTVCQYIKKLNTAGLSPERCINLFHCLFEMNDHSMHEEIQKYLSSPKNIKQKLSPAHCSALAHILLMSKEVLDEFDLKKYNTSDEGRRRLIPAVRCCRKAEFSDCKLTEKSCEIMASALQSPNSLLQLDLSKNDLGDSGVQLLSKGLSSFNCKIQTLRLSKCGISDEGYVCLALTLMLNPSCVKELDVSNNHPGESAQKLLSATLEHPDRKVEALRFAECKLPDNKSLGDVASVLQSPNSLIELDLSTNDLGDSGVQLLSKGLSSPHCRLHKLSLQNCGIGEEGFKALASALRSNPSHMRELWLRENKAGDSGVKHLSSFLEDPNCKLDTLGLNGCRIGEEGFTALASALRSNPSHMRDLGLRGSKAGDSGVKHLSSFLEDPNCTLEKLGLQNCSIGEEGFTALVSALRSNPSHMRQLGLEGSKATDSGVKHLSSLLEDPNCKLEDLHLRNCSIGEEGFTALASALRSNPSHMRDLRLTENKATDSGVKHLSSLLEDPNCKMETLALDNCNIGEEGFTALASALRSNPSHMRQLWLRGSKAGDSGVKHLSCLLEDPNSKLEELNLYNCSITDKGLRILASALRSSPSALRYLDLRQNQPGPSAQQLLSELKKHPNCKHIQIDGGE
ncbi:NACHT, LRR and PYD domains-containing protein 3-like isoform X2 [Sardina pilchardus]|uniref:NACHT, LRR and PYD domains-containing protein 3-like isoform X2 n=1 Tax=Sardina pilchardus TaxID=27697 RepID=UPI002E164A48